ncbi:hypothetical protein D9M68_898470 [compost metagenome]
MGNHGPGFGVVQKHLLERVVFAVVQVVFALPLKGRQLNEECLHVFVRNLRIVSVGLTLCVKRGANQFEGYSPHRIGLVRFHEAPTLAPLSMPI